MVRGLQILFISLERKADALARQEQIWSRKDGLRLKEEGPNTVGHGLLFRGDQVKVCALGKEFFGDAEHQLTQRRDEEGRMEWILTF